jgi:N-methylhydantoinase A
LAEDAEAVLTVERQVSMRYAGQGWEIPVALDDDSTFDEFAAELLSAKFTKAYEEFFGRAIDDLAIETVSWSVRVSSIVPTAERVELSIASSSVAEPAAHRVAYDAASGQRVETAVIDRNELTPGTRLHGPAIIAEAQTTTVLASHHTCTVQVDGTLLITRDRSGQ